MSVNTVPEVEQIVAVPEHPTRNRLLAGILLLLVLYTCAAAAVLIVPLLLALLLSLMLAPAVRLLCRWHLPRSLATLVVLLSTIMHLLEGQLVTPLIVGRRLALDPVMVFIALMLFGWLWGVAGLLLAMPLLSCMRIFAERIPAWNVLGKMLAA